MPRNRQASEQARVHSRRQILAAARRLFASRGYFACRVSEVAREAGMSQGNVYWYFPSKEELLKAVLADGFAAMEQLLAEAASHPGSASQKLEHLIDRFLAFLRERGDFALLFLPLLAHGGPAFFRELGFDTVQIGTGYHRHLAALFAQARSEGLVADLDPDLLAALFFSFFNGLMITYGEDWARIPPDLLREAVLRLVGACGGGVGSGGR